jgi:hypothetical protein
MPAHYPAARATAMTMRETLCKRGRVQFSDAQIRNCGRTRLCGLFVDDEVHPAL